MGLPRLTQNRKVLDVGTLPNSTTKNVAHGIGSLDVSKVKAVYGWADDGTYMIPLPHTDQSFSADCVELRVTATNVEVTISGSNYTSFSGTVVIEWDD